jgi:ATP-dependent DNA ligase
MLRNRLLRFQLMCSASERLHRYNPSMPSKSTKATSASFIETMDCLPAVKIPEGPEWTYEVKLDGYRLEAVKSKRAVTLYSRRKNVLNQKFGYIARALEDLPDETVLDGELVGLDEQGISSFNLLQNFKSAEKQIHYYVFDVLVLKGKSLLARPLRERRDILAKVVPATIILISPSSTRVLPRQSSSSSRSTDSKVSSQNGLTASTSRGSAQDCGRRLASIWDRSLSWAVTRPEIPSTL